MEQCRSKMVGSYRTASETVANVADWSFCSRFLFSEEKGLGVRRGRQPRFLRTSTEKKQADLDSSGKKGLSAKPSNADAGPTGGSLAFAADLPAFLVLYISCRNERERVNRYAAGLGSLLPPDARGGRGGRTNKF